MKHSPLLPSPHRALRSHSAPVFGSPSHPLHHHCRSPSLSFSPTLPLSVPLPVPSHPHDTPPSFPLPPASCRSSSQRTRRSAGSPCSRPQLGNPRGSRGSDATPRTRGTRTPMARPTTRRSHARCATHPRLKLQRRRAGEDTTVTPLRAAASPGVVDTTFKPVPINSACSKSRMSIRASQISAREPLTPSTHARRARSFPCGSPKEHFGILPRSPFLVRRFAPLPRASPRRARTGPRAALRGR